MSYVGHRVVPDEDRRINSQEELEGLNSRRTFPTLISWSCCMREQSVPASLVDCRRDGGDDSNSGVLSRRLRLVDLRGVEVLSETLRTKMASLRSRYCPQIQSRVIDSAVDWCYGDSSETEVEWVGSVPAKMSNRWSDATDMRCTLRRASLHYSTVTPTNYLH